MRYISVYHVALATIAAAPAIVYAAPSGFEGSGFEGGAPFILRSNPQQDNAEVFKNKYGKSFLRRDKIQYTWSEEVY